jgi:hypothetical protein
VTGNGTVTGGGIRCGNTSTVCTANQAVNAIVTLTELKQLYANSTVPSTMPGLV